MLFRSEELPLVVADLPYQVANGNVIRVYEHDARSYVPDSETDATGDFLQRPRVGEWTLPKDLMDAHTLPGAKHAIMRVYGDSMAPYYMPGDRIIVDCADTTPSPSGPFVIWNGIAYTIVRLQVILGISPLRVRVISDNEKYENTENALSDLDIVGRVFGKWLLT